MLGDNMYGGQTPKDFIDKFERPYAALLEAKVPFFAALGNHDRPDNRFYTGFDIIDRFLVLPLGAAIAIVWANLAGESYFSFAHGLAFPVNEIGMAFFLALLTQEVVEATMPGGALHTWRRWSLPIVGAVGGGLGAVATYLAWVAWRHELVLAAAWPIASAIDIAAGYYVLKIVKPRHGAIPFLLLLAIATNALGLVAMGLGTFRVGAGAGGAALVVGAVGLAALLRRRRVAGFWPYIAICGTLSWIGCYLAGAHPALALVPMVPFLPHRPRAHNPFADPTSDDSVHHVEREWNHGVQAVLFLFGLVNAGVLMSAYDTGTWAILAASMIGRPLGMRRPRRRGPVVL
jgi:NhaA family Na+:H+ antiporter